LIYQFQTQKHQIMKKLLFAFALVFIAAIAPSCTNSYDEDVILEQTTDPDTGTAGGGPVNPPPTTGG
jgi:hypothetical protein